jgi:threonine synthase
MRTGLSCGCGKRFPWRSPRTRCSCGGLLDVVIPRPRLRGRALRALFDGRQGEESGVWRFHEAVLPESIDRISHPEGNTPLHRRAAFERFAGLADLSLKHEGVNPTGSFKDRGMTVACSQAVAAGARAVACASTGNTSASMAAYAAQAGLPALVLVPRGKIALGKLAQALAYGARTLLVKGDFDTCLRLAEEASAAFGIALLNSINPWRIEGQKTIVLEALAQRGWDPPDWIVLPAGNLGNLSAFGKALREAREWGLIRRVPRLAAIQAAGASPFYRSWRRGFRVRVRVRAETVATAIRIGDPASFDRGVAAIRETDGVVATVTDGEILEAKSVIDRAGVGCEPASAASLAGTRKLVGAGVIKRGESVVGVLTGALLKDPEIILKTTRNRPVPIPPRIDAVRPFLLKP